MRSYPAPPLATQTQTQVIINTGPQLGSVARCPSQTVVQVRHVQAQVCHRQFNTYQAKIS